ncbi:hypothetical protein EVAR_61277_1 [Eumeta japonica]|uniref:Uncharacterized protein n=1 Tax=Eumeta variegata TaxID=151549 RepID=A0A4C1Z8Y5_EUMVA|nr:hypothetical protein EVAR_61277_1 [Eumeta japonica]
MTTALVIRYATTVPALTKVLKIRPALLCYFCPDSPPSPRDKNAKHANSPRTDRPGRRSGATSSGSGDAGGMKLFYVRSLVFRPRASDRAAETKTVHAARARDLRYCLHYAGRPDGETDPPIAPSHRSNFPNGGRSSSAGRCRDMEKKKYATCTERHNSAQFVTSVPYCYFIPTVPFVDVPSTRELTFERF